MTNRTNLTPASLPALVDLIRSVRPAWDERPIRNALYEVRGRGDLAYVAYRCLKAAADPYAQTPAALTFDQWWAEPDHDKPARRVREVCFTHGLPLPCRDCGATSPNRPERTNASAETAKRGAQAAREALHAAQGARNDEGVPQ